MTTGPIGKLVISGVIDGVQSWSIGLTCEAQTAPTSAELTAWLNGVSPLVSTWWGATVSPKAANKASCTLTQLAAYGYSNVNTPATGSALLVLGTPLVGTSGVVTPTQSAIVATLRTPFPGRHNVGRIYIPATGAPLGSNNRLTSSFCTGMATSTAAFLTSLAGLTINGTTTSAVIVPSSGAGTSHYVSQVSVGDVVDTQRRRRDKYVENRYSHTV